MPPPAGLSRAHPPARAVRAPRLQQTRIPLQTFVATPPVARAPAAPACPLTVGERIGQLEAALVATFPAAECPVIHRFTPGLYIRETHLPAGAIITSKIHKTEHPFVITRGRVSVYSENDGVQHLHAPHTGITRPGTRRILVIHEDTVWTTFHPTPHTDVARIEADIIEPHQIPLTLNAGASSPCLGSQSE